MSGMGPTELEAPLSWLLIPCPAGRTPVGMDVTWWQNIQSYEAEYRPEATEDILKWKPASHNSVDFTVLAADQPLVLNDPRCRDAVDSGQDYFLGVLSRTEVVVAFEVSQGAHGDLVESMVPLRIEFPSGVNPDEYLQKVVECNYDEERKMWLFMRDRAKCALRHGALCVSTQRCMWPLRHGARAVQGQGASQCLADVPQGDAVHLLSRRRGRTRLLL